MFDAAALKADFGRAAKRYAAHAALQRQVLSHCLKLAQAHIPAGSTVLDAGCGPGVLAGMAEGRWALIGLDLAHAMCAQAREAHGLPCITADAQALPLRKACMDGVISSLMLQWADAPERVLAEWARCLKPGGIVVLATFGPQTLHELRDALSPHAPRISPFAAISAVRAQAEAAGFAVVQEESICLVEHYPSLPALMRQLKSIGATNKRHDRPRGLTSPAVFTRAEAEYRARYSDERGLRVTWKVGYWVFSSPLRGEDRNP